MNLKERLRHHVTGAIERGEAVAIEGKPAPNRWHVYWSPEGRCIATVDAVDAKAAIRQAPMPYRKFLGELYAEPVTQG